MTHRKTIATALVSLVAAALVSPALAEAKPKKASTSMVKVKADAKALAKSTNVLAKKAKGVQKARLKLAEQQLARVEAILAGGTVLGIQAGEEHHCEATAGDCAAHCEVPGDGYCNATATQAQCISYYPCGQRREVRKARATHLRVN